MSTQFTAFLDKQRIAHGSPAEVALALHGRPAGQVLVFDDATGRQTELDPQHSPASESPAANIAPSADTARSRGRPRLGVVAREVTLLPRHWEWLASQPGGASVTLRKLVEHASKHPDIMARQRQDAAYYFLSAIAGDLPQYEAALRALYANDRDTLTACMSGWPADIVAYALARLEGR